MKSLAALSGALDALAIRRRAEEAALSRALGALEAAQCEMRAIERQLAEMSSPKLAEARAAAAWQHRLLRRLAATRTQCAELAAGVARHRAAAAHSRAREDALATLIAGLETEARQEAARRAELDRPPDPRRRPGLSASLGPRRGANGLLGAGRGDHDM